MSRARPLIALVLLGLAVPATAKAGCRDDQAADRLFAHPYGEPGASKECRDEDEAGPRLKLEPHSPDLTIPTDLREGEGRQLRVIGMAGMGSGASVAALGGVSALLSFGFKPGTDNRAGFQRAGAILGIAGGGLALVGAALVGWDALTAPAPTPDGRGLQLTLAMRW